MNWEAVGAIAELLGAIAVVATLIYLAIQVRHSKNALELNANTVRAEAGRDVNLAWSDWCYNWSSHPDRRVIDRLYQPDAKLADFSRDDQFVAGLFLRACLQRFHSEYSLFQQGLLSEEIWKRHRDYCKGLIEAPAIAELWETEKNQPLYAKDFVMEIEAADTSVPVTAGVPNA